MEGKNRKYLLEDLLGSRARVKILKIIANEGEINVSALIRKAKVNHKNAQKHLKYLKEVKLVEQKNFGRIKIFRFKKENVKAKSFKCFLAIWEN